MSKILLNFYSIFTQFTHFTQFFLGYKMKIMGYFTQNFTQFTQFLSKNE